MNSIFKNENELLSNEIPIEVFEVIKTTFGKRHYCKYFFKEIITTDEIIYLGDSAINMHGDGDTYLLEDHLINLEILTSTRFNSIDVYVCKKMNISKPAYAIYQLEDENLHILKY